MEKVNIAEKIAAVPDFWNPRLLGELNGQHIRISRLKGKFVWHSHTNEDEMFLVVQGEFEMRFRDRTILLKEGEFLIVPRGVEHCPVAEAEATVLLFEPASTVNTGAIIEERTRAVVEPI